VRYLALTERHIQQGEVWEEVAGEGGAVVGGTEAGHARVKVAVWLVAVAGECGYPCDYEKI
jgi:hypothetical protein